MNKERERGGESNQHFNSDLKKERDFPRFCHPPTKDIMTLYQCPVSPSFLYHAPPSLSLSRDMEKFSPRSLPDLEKRETVFFFFFWPG